MIKRFPYRHGDYIQHVSGTGDRYIVRLVDDEVFEAYAENVDGGSGTRVINPDNWKRIPQPEAECGCWIGKDGMIVHERRCPERGPGWA